MEDRKKLGLQAAGLTLLPMVFVFPMLAVARFGPTGPASLWPVLLFAPLAMWMQMRALRVLLDMYRNGRDPVLIAILPLELFRFAPTLSAVSFWSWRCPRASPRFRSDNTYYSTSPVCRPRSDLKFLDTDACREYSPHNIRTCYLSGSGGAHDREIQHLRVESRGIQSRV